MKTLEFARSHLEEKMLLSGPDVELFESKGLYFVLNEVWPSAQVTQL